LSNRFVEALEEFISKERRRIFHECGARIARQIGIAKDVVFLHNAIDARPQLTATPATHLLATHGYKVALRHQHPASATDAALVALGRRSCDAALGRHGAASL